MTTLWLIVLIVHFFFSTRYLASAYRIYKYRGNDPAVDDYAGRNLFASVILITILAALFLVTILELLRPTNQETISTVYLLALLGLPIPVHINSRRFVVGAEKTFKNSHLWQAGSMAAVLLMAVVSVWVIRVETTLKPAPFIYTNPAVEETYCTGHPFTVTFDIWVDGENADDIRVEGSLVFLELSNAGQPIDPDTPLDSIENLSRRETEAGQVVFYARDRTAGESRMVEGVVFGDYEIPRNVTNGLYIWRHRAFSVDDDNQRISQFAEFATEPFQVQDCVLEE